MTETELLIRRLWVRVPPPEPFDLQVRISCPWSLGRIWGEWFWATGLAGLLIGQCRRARRHDVAPRPSARLDDPLVELVVDVQLAGLEGDVLAEREAEQTRHLHRSQPEPLAVSGQVGDQGGEHRCEAIGEAPTTSRCAPGDRVLVGGGDRLEHVAAEPTLTSSGTHVLSWMVRRIPAAFAVLPPQSSVTRLAFST
jgi:hypothetical protein